MKKINLIAYNWLVITLLSAFTWMAFGCTSTASETTEASVDSSVEQLVEMKIQEELSKLNLVKTQDDPLEPTDLSKGEETQSELAEQDDTSEVLDLNQILEDTKLHRAALGCSWLFLVDLG